MQHPQIVNVVDIVEDNLHYNIISEVLEGGPILGRMLEHGAFKESEAVEIVRQLLEALRYLHQNSFMHRDIKLENILFVSKQKTDLRVKLIDFGFATKNDRKVS